MLSLSATVLISQTEAAKRAGVHRSTVWSWLKRGRLTQHKRALDGKVFVDADELAAKIRTYTPEPEGETREGKP